MSVDPVSAVAATASTTPVAKTAKSNGVDGMGEDSFMQLLLTQLKNQDPLQPMNDTEFIAQLAQFNSLNQLTQINKTMTEMMLSQSMGQASAMLGKTVTATLGTEAVSGVVSGIQLNNNKITLTVGDYQIPMENVRTVTQTPEPEPVQTAASTIDTTDTTTTAEDYTYDYGY